MNDTITKEQILAAYNNAPDFVRAVFNDEATTQVVIGLQSKLQLHVDAAGVLAKEVGYLLLGLVDPSKFVDRLKNSGFSEQAATEIITEINQKIFVPLREKMKSGAGNTQQPIRPTEPERPSVPPTTWRASVPPPRPSQVNASVPSYSYTPPTQTSQHFHLENKIPPPSRPVNIGRLLEDHEEPHIEIRDKVQGISLPGTNPPVSVPLTPSSAIPPGVRFSPRSVEAPSVVGPVVPKIETPIQKPFVPPVQSKPIPPAPPITKSYVDDPYREPIEEGGR
ncbi:MAG: hypothetical protein WC887_01925 [Candidatus Paceibacterota bacterium]